MQGKDSNPYWRLEELRARARLAQQQGDLAQAGSLLAAALDIRTDADSLVLYGSILAETRQTEEALDCARRAIQLEPSSCEILCNAGSLMHRLLRFHEAIECYTQALALHGSNEVLLGNRSVALHALGQYEACLDDLNAALTIAPADVENIINRANAFHALGRYRYALDDYSRAIELDSRRADAWMARANMRAQLGQLGDALADIGRSIELNPANPDAYFYRGNISRDLRNYDLALESYDRSIEIAPENIRANRNKGLCLLLMGRFEDGLPLYEWRKKLPVPIDARHYDAPLWTGAEEVWEKTLFLYIEQGLGDTIQFYRFVFPLLERGARIFLAVQDGLRNLLKPGDPRIQILGFDQVPDCFDFHAPLASIPLALGVTAGNIPAPIPYLRARADRIDSWRTRLGTHGFKIGVAWQGATGVDDARSFPAHLFREIAGIANVRLVSIQTGFGTEQLMSLPPGVTIERFDDLDQGGESFRDTAALMASLDLVVTPDTSLAHLAGALGVPACVMLKEVPDWRWMTNRDDSPWYPSLQLIRQPAFDDWVGAFQLLKDEIIRRMTRLAAARP